MSFRQIWIVSVSNRSLVYNRHFANNERKALRIGLTPCEPNCEKQLVDSLLRALSIDDSKSINDCSAVNQLPVIGITLDNSKLWPIVVIERNGILFTGLCLSERTSGSECGAEPILMEENAIALCFTALQLIAHHFSVEKSLSWIEWFIVSEMPFGALVNTKYQTLTQSRKEKSDHLKQQNDLTVKVIVNELITATKTKESVFGTISVVTNDDSTNNYLNTNNDILTINVKNIESLNLIVPQNCNIYGSDIELRASQSANPLSIIHYKCNTSPLSVTSFLSYDYTNKQDANQIGLNHFQITIYLKNSQLKFSYFNIHFKHPSDNNLLTPTKSNLSYGQLRLENNGLFWVIGNKFPKSGQIKLNFDLLCHSSKTVNIETICNFKIENFHASRLLTKSEHLTIGDIKWNVNNKLPIYIESALTSIDYKLYPN